MNALLQGVQEFLDQSNALKAQLAALGFKMNQANLREMFATMVRLYMTDYDSTIRTIDDTVLNGNYPVPIRIYVPPAAATTQLPVAIYLHGGGHVVGSVAIYDMVVRKLAQQIQHIIVAVDYRLSPEFAYPTAINDCKSVIQEVFPILERAQITTQNKELTLIGDSAGGALCASIVMDEDFVAQYNITRQVLVYPSLDYTGSSKSVQDFARGYLLEKAKLEWYLNQYFQNNEDRKQASPFYGKFYAAMPKTMVLVASHDPLHDEGVAYYDKLVATGIRAELLSIEGVLHGFFLLENLNKDECNTAYRAINKFLL